MKNHPLSTLRWRPCPAASASAPRIRCGGRWEIWGRATAFFSLLLWDRFFFFFFFFFSLVLFFVVVFGFWLLYNYIYNSFVPNSLFDFLRFLKGCRGRFLGWGWTSVFVLRGGGLIDGWIDWLIDWLATLVFVWAYLQSAMRTVWEDVWVLGRWHLELWWLGWIREVNELKWKVAQCLITWRLSAW